VAVQPAERVLDHILGGGPVAQHDDGEPDQPDRVRLIQGGDGLRGVRAGFVVRPARPGTRPVGSCAHWYAHVSETPRRAASCSRRSAKFSATKVRWCQRSSASWCGSNTVRLQIFQFALLGPGKSGVTVNTTFPGLIEGEVSTLNDGLVVVINDQTEGGGNPNARGMPTKQTEAFWKVMSGLYGHNPDVIFDLFNEPRRANYPTEAGRWKFWKHGGGYHGYQFIGMEPLAL
jgi:hypothetical protein